jgi:hypothetical protein
MRKSSGGANFSRSGDPVLYEISFGEPKAAAGGELLLGIFRCLNSRQSLLRHRPGEVMGPNGTANPRPKSLPFAPSMSRTSAEQIGHSPRRFGHFSFACFARSIPAKLGADLFR